MAESDSKPPSSPSGSSSPGPSSSFDSTSASFLTWFTSQPGATFHPSLKLTDLRSRSAGRGIIATSDIPADTTLFTIPRASVISVANSTLSKKLPRIFTNLPLTTNDDDEMDVDIEFPDPWLDLIFVMVYEYLRGPESPWKEYFSVLPSNFDTLMYWNKDELSELQASAIKEKIGKEDADGMFKEKLVPVIRKHEDVFNVGKMSDEELVELAHRMGSTIMSYAFDLDNDGAGEEEEEEQDGWVVDNSGVVSMGMVPMADMLNADAEFNAHLNHDKSSLTMTSLRTITAGSEVLNYYGPLSNSELLRRYGYVSPLHTRYDVVEIPWTLITSVLLEHYPDNNSKLKLEFDEDDEDFEDSFVLERDSGDPDDTGVNSSAAVFKYVPEEMEEQIIRAIAPVLGIDVENSKVSKGDKKRLKGAALEVMVKVVERRLGQYNTGILEDEEVLKKEETKGRLRMAVEVRVGEKRLLKEVLARSRELEEEMKGEERGAKRVRV